MSGSPKALRSIIDIVRGLDLRALIVTTTILDDDNNDSTDQVLCGSHVPAHLVNPMADIAITHGGVGTVQTAIHSGTPLVGIPMHQEQAGNISLVNKQGSGLMLWKQELGKNTLRQHWRHLLLIPGFERENMKRQKLEQDKVDGAAKAAQETVNFL
ncbi:MAG: nucleotide disphospho-sugar-binding domain-containing protein [Thiohalocapsa sp.]